MGNITTKPKTEDADIKSFLRDVKEKFDSKWEMAYMNDKLVEFFNVNDFEPYKTVGVGSFGRVMVCHKKEGDMLLAVKCIRKECIIEKKQLDHTYSEYKILATVPPIPFLVNMVSFGQDNANLYMTFEFVPGGELFSLLRSVGKLPEVTASFYGAQIAAALEYLHNLDILFRDLKPENILFAANGYLKLTDFGFAKRCLGRTFTMCGTPEYLAPEVILCHGYHKAVDWWSFGVLMYEMVCGTTPFCSNNPMEIYKQEWLQKCHEMRAKQVGVRFNKSRFFKISTCGSGAESSQESSMEFSGSSLNVSSFDSETSPEHGPCSLTRGISKLIHLATEKGDKEIAEAVDYPEFVSENFKDFISKILQPNPTKRLGNLHNGSFDIKHHPLFAKVPWTSLFRQIIKAPYSPKFEGPSDTQNYKAFDSVISLGALNDDKYAELFSIFPYE